MNEQLQSAQKEKKEEEVQELENRIKNYSTSIQAAHEARRRSGEDQALQ